MRVPEILIACQPIKHPPESEQERYRRGFSVSSRGWGIPHPADCTFLPRVLRSLLFSYAFGFRKTCRSARRSARIVFFILVSFLTSRLNDRDNAASSCGLFALMRLARIQAKQC